jgi:hypothetical protein
VEQGFHAASPHLVTFMDRSGSRDRKSISSSKGNKLALSFH